MFRRMRHTEPNSLSIRLSEMIQPFSVARLGALAMSYLSVLIVVEGSLPLVGMQQPGHDSANHLSL